MTTIHMQISISALHNLDLYKNRTKNTSSTHRCSSTHLEAASLAPTSIRNPCQARSSNSLVHDSGHIICRAEDSSPLTAPQVQPMPSHLRPHTAPSAPRGTLHASHSLGYLCIKLLTQPIFQRTGNKSLTLAGSQMESSSQEPLHSQGGRGVMLAAGLGQQTPSTEAVLLLTSFETIFVPSLYLERDGNASMPGARQFSARTPIEPTLEPAYVHSRTQACIMAT